MNEGSLKITPSSPHPYIVSLTVFEPYGGHALTKATLRGKVLTDTVYIFTD